MVCYLKIFIYLQCNDIHVRRFLADKMTLQSHVHDQKRQFQLNNQLYTQMNFTTKAVEALTLQRNGQFQKKTRTINDSANKSYKGICTCMHFRIQLPSVQKLQKKRTIHFYNKIKYFGVNILFKRVHKNLLYGHKVYRVQCRQERFRGKIEHLLLSQKVLHKKKKK